MSSWLLQEKYRKRAEFRKQEERRRKRLLLDQEENDGFSSNPTKSSSTEKEIEKGHKQGNKKESPLTLLRRESENKKKLIESKWLDTKTPVATKTKSTTSKKIYTERSTAKASKKRALISITKPDPPCDDSWDDEDNDLLEVFRKQQNELDSETDESSTTSNRRRSGVEKSQSDNLSRKTKAYETNEDIDECSTQEADSISRSSSGEASESLPKRSLDKSLMHDSSDEEARKCNDKDEIPHNPIALMKNSTRAIATRENSPCPNDKESTNLWSDSEPDEDDEIEEVPKRRSNVGLKKKRKFKQNRNFSPRKKSTTGRVYDDCSSDEEGGVPTIVQDQETQKSALKPELENPHFGPFALEPLILKAENGEQEHAVPPALNRYLADFQKEGVRFLHKCLTSKTGAILGDEMGCGKTVQVLSLLTALYGKTGTGTDLAELIRRRTLVKAKKKIRKKKEEEALLDGRIIADDDVEDWKEDLMLPEWYPVLIVVPPTTIENWKNEFARFTHFAVATYQGDQREKAMERLSDGTAEILLTARSLLQQKESFKQLNKISWKLVIIDEFHLFKNPDGQLSCHLRNLKAKHPSLIIGMTGTLMQNDHKELWNLIDLVESGYLGEWEEFRRSVSIPIKMGRTKTADASTIQRSTEKSDALIRKLRKILIERKKEDVLKGQLPTKSEQVVFCEPSPLQKQIYKHILTLPDVALIQNAFNPCDCSINAGFFRRYQKLASAAERIDYYRQHKKEIIPQWKCCYKTPLNPLREEEGQPIIDPDAALWRMLNGHEDNDMCKNCPLCCFFPAAQKLNQLSSHIALLQAKQTQGSNEVGSSEHKKYVKALEFAKVAFPPDVVSQLPGGSIIRKDGIMDDHFALSGKLKVLDKLLRQYNDANSRVLLFSYSTQMLDLIQNYVRSKGYRYLRMDGSTASSRRQEIADQFNKDPSIFLLLLSTKAMGLGLNLTAANKVIIYDVEWNPSWDEQAQDRAYRIGQKQDVQVIRLVSCGTIDEQKYLRQIYKVQLKRETLETHDSSEQAARMFRGVQGDKERKGELFGVANILKFKDGCFLDDIWKHHGTQQPGRRTGGLDIYETTKLTDKLLGIGNDACDEILTGPSDLDKLMTQKDGKAEGDDKDPAKCLDAEEEQLVDAQALNHEDLFRADRGRAAIERGEQGFDEEMGGGTQNIYAMFERGGMTVHENPQDGELSDHDDNRGDNEQQVQRHTPPRSYRDERTVASEVVSLHLNQARDQSVPENAVNHRSPNQQPARSLSRSLFDERQSETDPATIPRIQAPNELPVLPRTSNSDVRNINLMGMSSVQLARNHIRTTFSVEDLPLPSYRGSKPKKKRKKKSS